MSVGPVSCCTTPGLLRLLMLPVYLSIGVAGEGLPRVIEALVVGIPGDVALGAPDLGRGQLRLGVSV